MIKEKLSKTNLEILRLSKNYLKEIQNIKTIEKTIQNT